MIASPDRGLSRRERIRKRPEFVRIQNGAGARARGPGFTVLIQPRLHGEEATTRIGLVASRRVGNAIRRNRAKRLLRELYRLHKAEFPQGFDLVFVCHAELASRSLADLESALPALLAELARRARALARKPDRSQAGR